MIPEGIIESIIRVEIITTPTPKKRCYKASLLGIGDFRSSAELRCVVNHVSPWTEGCMGWGKLTKSREEEKVEEELVGGVFIRGIFGCGLGGASLVSRRLLPSAHAYSSVLKEKYKRAHLAETNSRSAELVGLLEEYRGWWGQYVAQASSSSSANLSMRVIPPIHSVRSLYRDDQAIKKNESEKVMLQILLEVARGINAY
ncbi:hypothetical protein BDZ91DRAFT_760831 [Kalaharituber pfeilii]|nr:hypothetical protein BDZ91DRAFT_760831 [Kalaharituber pfeilii]